MPQFVLKFKEDYACGDEPLERIVSIETTDYQTVVKIGEMVKTIKEEVDRVIGEGLLEYSDELDARDLYLMECCKLFNGKVIKEELSMEFLGDFKSNEELSRWEDTGWPGNIDKVLDFLETASTDGRYKVPLKVYYGECAEVCIN